MKFLEFFDIEEELIRGVQGCSGNFVLAPAVTQVQVLHSENIFTFQLTADVKFFGRKEVVSSRKKNILGRYG